MSLAKLVLGLLAGVYLIISVGYGIREFQKAHDFDQACMEKVKIYGSPEEYIGMIAGASGRDNYSVFKIAFRALSWPEKLVMFIFEPKLLDDGLTAYSEIEQTSHIASIEDKYCSNMSVDRKSQTLLSSKG